MTINLKFVYVNHEKEHVERSVEFIRRKAFVSTYRFSSLEELKLILTMN